MQCANNYAATHYQLVGITDISQENTTYLWGDGIAGYVPRSDSFITVWKRKSS
jgi:hypothetical protein